MINVVPAHSQAPKAKKQKLKIKPEDLDPGTVMLPAHAQDRLDRAFLGYVRINVVNPDPSARMEWKVINEREVDERHKKSIVASLRLRKEDWEHNMHMMVDGSKIDKSCLARSPFPVKDLQPLVWKEDARDRVIRVLSGNHRRAATTAYQQELLAEKATVENLLARHEEQQGRGGQQTIGEDGELVDEVANGLRLKIAALSEAVEDAEVWTMKVYDEGKFYWQWA